MNKKELIDAIAARAGVKKIDVEKVITTMEASVIDALRSGDKVSLVGFGTFSAASRKERKGRNPQTGEGIMIAARKAPKFVAGKNFKEALLK